MRILHTSDWHLGRALEGRERDDEQREVLSEVAGLLDSERVDLLLVAGDVFDSGNPPASAEQLFFDALEEMSQGGRRAIVVLAGNHDSPERLVAANPLAARFGISLVGLPSDVLTVQDAPGHAHRVRCAPSFIELAIPGVPHKVAVAALPYPSEARLREVLSESSDEREQQQAYSDRVRGLLQNLAALFSPDAVNIVASHLYVVGGQESESERPIQLGGACAVAADVFPETAQYVALGHLHRPQEVAGCPVPARYAGSPLACGFAEAGQQKSVVLIDVEPGSAANVRTVALKSGRPLVRWDVAGFVEALGLCEQGKDPEAWIDLTLRLDAPLAPSQVQALRKARPRIVGIRPILPDAQRIASSLPPQRRPVDALFAEFYRRSCGAEPDPEMLKLFLELLDEDPSTPDGAAP